MPEQDHDPQDTLEDLVCPAALAGPLRRWMALARKGHRRRRSQFDDWDQLREDVAALRSSLDLQDPEQALTVRVLAEWLRLLAVRCAFELETRGSRNLPDVDVRIAWRLGFDIAAREAWEQHLRTLMASAQGARQAPDLMASPAPAKD